MRHALNNLNTDLVLKHPNYVARVTSEEGKIGKGRLSRFQELETASPDTHQPQLTTTFFGDITQHEMTRQRFLVW